MHPFSILTLGIFVAGYTTARWDLVTRLYELTIFAWDHGVVVSRYKTACLCKANVQLVSGYKRVRHPILVLLPPCHTHRKNRFPRNAVGQLRKHGHHASAKRSISIQGRTVEVYPHVNS